MYVRRNIWTLDPDPTVRSTIAQAYAAAVKEMKERSFNNPQ